MDKIFFTDWRGNKKESSLQKYIHTRLDGNESRSDRFDELRSRFDAALENTSHMLALICEKTNIPIEDIAELIGNRYDGRFEYKGNKI